MGADQQFCLRWNNFHTNITSAFESLRDDEDFVDITLACEGRQVKAHKMVLSACSPYFRSLLKGNPCQHPIVFLKDVTFANLASILDFMYHGEVNVSHNELATFLKTAEALKVRGLAEDDKRKDSDGYVDASSPGPPRDPPDPNSPRPDETSATDTHLSESPPPHKKRRRSGTSVQSAEDTNETVISEIKETSVKNEPQEFNDEDDILGHSVDTGDIKADNVGVSTSSAASGGNEDGEDRSNFGLSDSVTISRNQAAMQQLQESFGSFLPAMSQSSGFLPHGATDMPRPPFNLEGVQGLPPGISTLPGPSMSQAGASQDTSQGEGNKDKLDCTYCGKNCSSRYNLKKHIRDIHLNKGNKFICQNCNRTYSSLNSLQVHRSVTHPTGNRRRHHQGSSRRRSMSGIRSSDEISLDQEPKDDDHDGEEIFCLSPKGHSDHSNYKSPPDGSKTDNNSMQSRFYEIPPAPIASSPKIIDQSISSHSSHGEDSHDIRGPQIHASSPSLHGERSPHFSTPISPQLSSSLSPQMRTAVSPHGILPSHSNLSSNQFSLPYHQTQPRISSHHQTSSHQVPLSLPSLQHKPSKNNNPSSSSSMPLYPSHFSGIPHHSFQPPHHSSSSHLMPSSYQMHSSPSFSPVTSPFSTDEMPCNQNDSEDISPYSHSSLNA